MTNHNDPRLANLPEDLRKVAAEFLDLHDGWGTEFRTTDVKKEERLRNGGVFTYLMWFSNSEASASAKLSTHGDLSLGACSVGDIGRIDIYTRTLRKSLDFAEFIKRFTKGKRHE